MPPVKNSRKRSKRKCKKKPLRKKSCRKRTWKQTGTRFRKVKYNPDVHCGVVNSAGLPCRRVITCHLHKVAQKKLVPGRSNTYDNLSKKYKLRAASEAASMLKGYRYDPDEHCGVQNADGYPCCKTIFCNTHLIHEKKTVEGRSKSIMELLKARRAKSTLKRKSRNKTSLSPKPNKSECVTLVVSNTEVHSTASTSLQEDINDGINTSTTESNPKQIPEVTISASISSETSTLQQGATLLHQLVQLSHSEIDLQTVGHPIVTEELRVSLTNENVPLVIEIPEETSLRQQPELPFCLTFHTENEQVLWHGTNNADQDVLFNTADPTELHEQARAICEVARQSCLTVDQMTINRENEEVSLEETDQPIAVEVPSRISTMCIDINQEPSLREHQDTTNQMSNNDVVVLPSVVLTNLRQRPELPFCLTFHTENEQILWHGTNNADQEVFVRTTDPTELPEQATAISEIAKQSCLTVDQMTINRENEDVSLKETDQPKAVDIPMDLDINEEPSLRENQDTNLNSNNDIEVLPSVAPVDVFTCEIQPPQSFEDILEQTSPTINLFAMNSNNHNPVLPSVPPEDVFTCEIHLPPSFDDLMEQVSPTSNHCTLDSSVLPLKNDDNSCYEFSEQSSNDLVDIPSPGLMNLMDEDSNIDSVLSAVLAENSTISLFEENPISVEDDDFLQERIEFASPLAQLITTYLPDILFDDYINNFDM